MTAVEIVFLQHHVTCMMYVYQQVIYITKLESQTMKLKGERERGGGEIERGEGEREMDRGREKTFGGTTDHDDRDNLLRRVLHSFKVQRFRCLIQMLFEACVCATRG